MSALRTVKQSKECAAAAAEQSAERTVLQKQLTAIMQLLLLLFGAKLLKDILHGTGDGFCFAGGQCSDHLLHIGMCIGSSVTAGKGGLCADAKARLDDDNGTVRHRWQRRKILSDAPRALGTAAQTEGNVRSDGKSD